MKGSYVESKLFHWKYKNTGIKNKLFQTDASTQHENQVDEKSTLFPNLHIFIL